MTEVIQRETWGARFADGSGSRRLPAAEAWLHHSVTIAPNLTPPFDDEYQAMRTLESIGQQRFGQGISYTFCVMPNGRVYEGHSVHRIGAHTGGRNTVAIGICLVGNYQGGLSDTMVRAVAGLLRHCHGQGWLARPQLNGGHRDVKATGCPGDGAYRRIAEINRLALLPTTPDPEPEPHIPDKVRPMFDPPHQLQPIVDAQRAPEGGSLLLGLDGSVYAYGGALYPGGANGQPWFAGRRAARLDYVGDPANPAGLRRWRITAHTGETYHLPTS